MGKLFKRGAVWYTWLRDGRGDWSKRSTNCTDKRAAEGVAAELERDSADPAIAAARKATTEGLLRSYLASRKRLGRSDGTMHHVHTKSVALVTLYPTLAADITHSAGERYIDARLAQGVMRTTIKKEFRVLKAALKLAKKNGEWMGDPDAVIPTLDDDHEPRERTLEPWELVGLSLVLRADRMALVAFAVATGCDFSALFRARRVDVNGDCSSVHVRGTKRKSRDRVVPVPLPMQRALLSWAMARAGNDVLFTPWANMVRDLGKACATLGIPACTANDLRRTYGTWLRNAGVEPQLIAPAMGHVDSRMVERVYGRLTPDALAKLVDERVRPAGLLMGGEGAVSGTSGRSEEVRPETGTAANQPNSRCAGAESNRRHGDFQSATPIDAITCESAEVGAEPPRAWVTNGLQLGGPSFDPRRRCFYCAACGTHFDALKPVSGVVDCPKCEAPAREVGTKARPRTASVGASLGAP